MQEWISNRGAIFDRFFFDLGPFGRPSWGQDGPQEGPKIDPENDRKKETFLKVFGWGEPADGVRPRARSGTP